MVPGGPIGDESNGAATDAAIGVACILVRQASDNYKNMYSITDYSEGLTDGVYPVLYAAFANTGSGTFTTKVRFEWAVVDFLPSGEWSS